MQNNIFMQNVFMARLDKDGNIYQVDKVTNSDVVVGVDMQTVKEFEDTITSQQDVIDNYYNKLVELGVIEVAKTSEQIALESAEKQLKIVQDTAEKQQQILENQNAVLNKMMVKLENMEAKTNKTGGEKDELFNENDERAVNTVNSKVNKKK